MKRFTVILIAIMTLFVFSATALAEDAAPTPAVNADAVFSPDQKAAAKGDLKALGTLFGLEATPAPAPQENGQQNPAVKKTVVDVADKALDMVGNLVGVIAKKVEDVAPEIWRIMVLQQYAKATSMVIVPWGFVLLTLLYMVIAKKAWKLSDEEAKSNYFNKDSALSEKGWKSLCTGMIPLIIIFCTVWWGLSRFSDAALMAINPKYYAVQDLLRMLLNSSGTGM